MTSPYRDHRDQPVDAPPPPGPDGDAFYRPIGDFQGAEYRRNAFASGTAEEVAVLRGVTGLAAGQRVLDVGCGDGRHLRALAATGVGGVGVDVSGGLLDAARAAAVEAGVAAHLDWVEGDARDLIRVLGQHDPFDVAWTLCQGALGTSPASDPMVLRGLADAVRPGGTVVFTVFHALFAARHLAPGDAFDPVDLVHHQVAEVRGPDHARRSFSLWTASYTVRDAMHLAEGAGLTVVEVRGVEPGAYGRRQPGEIGLDDPELLIVARRRRAPPGSPPVR